MHLFSINACHPHHNILIINYRCLFIDRAMLVHDLWICTCIFILIVYQTQILLYASGHYTLLIKTCAFYVHIIILIRRFFYLLADDLFFPLSFCFWYDDFLSLFYWYDDIFVSIRFDVRECSLQMQLLLFKLKGA